LNHRIEQQKSRSTESITYFIGLVNAPTNFRAIDNWHGLIKQLIDKNKEEEDADQHVRLFILLL